MAYNWLPGMQVETVDGGLRAKRNPNSQSVLIIGTAGKGPGDNVYQVVDRPTAAQIFGFDGTLIRGMEEVATYSDNIFLFRMGTKPATLKGIGKDTGVAGIDITLTGDRSADVDVNTRIYYKDGVLYVWNNEALIYANDEGNQVVYVAEEIEVSGAGDTGKGLAIGTGKTWAQAVTLAAAAEMEDVDTALAPVLDKTGVDGLGMNARETYVALAKALELLDIFPVQHVYCPNAVLDNPNVAFYVSTDVSTAAHNPATNEDALDWLKTSVAADGHTVYHWASEANDSDGANVVAHAVWTDAEDRMGDDYHEVSFGYALARFANKQSKINANQGGCLAYIGCKGPKDFSIPNLRKWIGKKPTYDINTGEAVQAGYGLLGIPYLSGTSQAALNLLCHDKSTGRSSGFFENDADEYDGGSAYDKNHFPIDIGAYLHVAGDWALVQNGFGNYTGNIAGLVCGFVSNMDPKSSTTNKPVVSVTQRYKPTNAQLDALTSIGVNMLRFHGFGEQPRLTHGMTAANRVSDYDRLVRQRIKFLVMQVTANGADPFIGESSTDGLQLQAMKTALDAAYLNLKKRGYMGMYRYVISSTEAQQKIGQATIEITFNPAEELVQLRAVVGLSRK